RVLEKLNQSSGYTCNLIVRKMPCLVLTRFGNLNRFISKSKGTSYSSDSLMIAMIKYPMDSVLTCLSWHSLSRDRLVVNETGYDGPIDLTLHAPFDDLAGSRKQLNDQGLDLVKAERRMEIFEIQ